MHYVLDACGLFAIIVETKTRLSLTPTILNA
jgi:hypothetical protein